MSDLVPLDMMRSERLETFGSPDAKILILIDHPDDVGIKSGKILGGPALGVLQNCLHMADLISMDVCMYAIVDSDPRYKKWWMGANTKKPLQDTTLVIERIKMLLAKHPDMLVIAMGDLSHYLLTGKRSLNNTKVIERGYVYPCSLEGFSDRNVLSVQDPKWMVWGNYMWRYTLANDFKKAKNNSEGEFQYDEKEVEVITNLLQAIGYIDSTRSYCIQHGNELSVDIEVANFEVSHIGFSVNNISGFSIPFNNNTWDIHQETTLWIKIAELLSDCRITKTGQNFLFDIHFLVSRNNIYVKGPIKDTMIASSIMFPDFFKSLGFLGSIYLNVPEWKSLGDHRLTDIKKDN